MKRAIKLVLLMPLLLLASCSEEHIYVTSQITNKYHYTYYQVVSTGKTTITIPHKRYVFQFNDWQPYKKSVSVATYNEYEIGDEYTFLISSEEKKYFFNEHIYVVEEE